MKKTLAIMLGKFTCFMVKLILRRPSSFIGGKMALKVDPELLGKIKMPEKVVCITGTNGKTTTTNILIDIVKEAKFPYISNDRGSNMLTGITNIFLENGNLKGETNAKLAIFEVDERFSPKIYKYISPDMLIITNILRDSMKRNANTDYISYILSSSIPKKTKLFLNGDDIIASTIAPENDREYYGISKLDTDKNKLYNLVSDAVFYPNSDTKLEYDFVRINHQGRIKKKEGLFTPDLNYEVINIDFEKKIMTIKFFKENKTYDFHIIQENIANIYNELSAIITAYNLGISIETIQKAVTNIKITETRYSEHKLKDNKKLVKSLSKGQNPAACSSVIKFISSNNDRKKVIINLADKDDNAHSSETIMWIYETDFEFLNDDSIKEIILIPPREKDFLVRLKLAGIDENKIKIYTNNQDIVDDMNLNDIDSIYILNDMFVEKESVELKNMILDKFS